MTTNWENVARVECEICSENMVKQGWWDFWMREWGYLSGHAWMIDSELCKLDSHKMSFREKIVSSWLGMTARPEFSVFPGQNEDEEGSSWRKGALIISTCGSWWDQLVLCRPVITNGRPALGRISWWTIWFWRQRWSYPGTICQGHSTLSSQHVLRAPG